MRYCFYTCPPMRPDYTKYFKPNEPIEVHLVGHSTWNKTQKIYLVKKHTGIGTNTHAEIDSDYKVIENYTGNDFLADYRPARRHFLWLTEDEMIWLTSNTKSKHVLERWDD